MARPLHAIDLDNFFACLVLEQIHGVRGMVPQQMISPGTRLTGSIDVLASEKKRLHVHLLNSEFSSSDFVVDPLM